MDQTASLPTAADMLDSETNPEAQEDRRCKTVVLADITPQDAGLSALARLEALSSLVQREATRDDPPPSGAPSTHVPARSEESLDDYMKLFMERMTGKKVEVESPVQPAQPLPTSAPVEEVRQPTRAPENSASLCQMRDLANASSRNAMQVHECRQLSGSVLATFLAAATASLASSGLAVMSAMHGSAWWQAGSLALLVAALALAWKCWSTSRKSLLDVCRVAA